MQAIVITSDNYLHLLKGFFHQWRKYIQWNPNDIYVCGYRQPDFDIPANFISLGNQEDYPVNKWSDALIKILGEVAEDVFLLMLDDFWLLRQADNEALKMMYDYMHQFSYVLKFDPTSERLHAWGVTDYGVLGHLDLIKSSPASMYHMSLWGGFWRRDLMKKFIIPGETAQQIELVGTPRVASAGDNVLVLGTKQCPIKHGNVVQAGTENQDVMVGMPALKPADLDELKKKGYVQTS
jgi:hypothetical protein